MKDDGFLTHDPEVSYQLLEQALGRENLESAGRYIMFNLLDFPSENRQFAEDEARATLVDILRTAGVGDFIREARGEK